MEVFVALRLGNSPVRRSQAASWITNSALNIVRHSHAAALLLNGKVLIAAGSGGNGVPTNSAEIHDPATQMWIPTDPLEVGRFRHTATLLPNGRVLIAGADWVFSPIRFGEPKPRQCFQPE